MGENLFSAPSVPRVTVWGLSGFHFLGEEEEAEAFVSAPLNGWRRGGMMESLLFSSFFSILGTERCLFGLGLRVGVAGDVFLEEGIEGGQTKAESKKEGSGGLVSTHRIN